MFVVIVGGGQVGSHLASLLLMGGHEVHVVDERPDVLAKIHRELPTEVVFDGDGSDPEMLPEHVQELLDERGLERTICDYIAGMTDRYAVEEHQKLFDPTTRP